MLRGSICSTSTSKQSSSGKLVLLGAANAYYISSSTAWTNPQSSTDMNIIEACEDETACTTHSYTKVIIFCHGGGGSA